MKIDKATNDAYDAYGAVMRITDDTRLNDTFGDNLIWRDHDAEAAAKCEAHVKKTESHSRWIGLCAAFAFISYVVGAPLVAYMTSSFFTGLLVGSAPYLILAAHAILKDDDTFFWQLPWIMFTNIFSALFMLVGFGVILLCSTLQHSV